MDASDQKADGTAAQPLNSDLLGSKRKSEPPEHEAGPVDKKVWFPECDGCTNPCQKFSGCDSGHIVCMSCIKATILKVIQTDEMVLACPAEDCLEVLTLDSLEDLEPSFSIDLFRNHVQKRHILESEAAITKIEGIISCPKCQSLAVSEEESTFYQCANKDCHVIFCRYCKSSQATAKKARLALFNRDHENCRILQYGGQSSPSDLLAPPAHWDFFTDEQYKAALRQDHKKGTFYDQSVFEKLFATKMPKLSTEVIPYDLVGGYLTVRLSPESLEFKDIKSYYQRTSKKNVLDIYRVQNMTCWEKYVLKRKHMVKELGEDGIQEKFLYHGTSKETIEFIIREGFDFRKPSVTDAWYGKGNYFSDKAGYSEEYAKSNFLLMVCVLLGKITAGDPSFTHPPYDSMTGQMFNSCVDNMFRPLEFVIFSNDQCYPAYVIEFRKESFLRFF